MNRFFLCVAGEASGDRIGSSLVNSCAENNLVTYGAGGPRMQSAGLIPLVEYEGLAVNGFWDVVPKLGSLLQKYLKLRKSLLDPACCGLVCIDYPGINMRLYRLARKRNIPVFWVAPPQIWAWKSKRGKEFADQKVCVFFPWEHDAYQNAGALPVQVRHPLLQEIPTSPQLPSAFRLALLPGSRWPQACRNGDAYLKLARDHFPGSVVLVAPDHTLALRFKKRWPGTEVQVASADAAFWAGISHALCPPGTASLELALRGIRLVVYSRIDLITYILGKALLRIPHLALPNLLLKRRQIPEVLVPSVMLGMDAEIHSQIVANWQQLPADHEVQIARTLRQCLDGPELVQVFRDIG